MASIKENIANNDKVIIYIARDIERALGKIPKGNYFIISNKTEYANIIENQYPENILLIKSTEILDTYELLKENATLNKIEELAKIGEINLLVFKNTIQIENYCKDKNWKLLNPKAELSEKIENKITQVKWLSELSELLPPHNVYLVRDIPEDILTTKKVIILQWSHGHTGDGTILISKKEELDAIKNKFPNREARITDFVRGPMFTVNIVVTKDIILLGNISYQITGMLPFTDNPFSTIGNDWSVPHTILSENHIKQFELIAEKVGQKMQKDGWLGLFGIDVIYDEERDSLNLIEINARQPASTTYESQLQATLALNGVTGITTFEAHINALQMNTIKNSLIAINDGAQILQRVTTKTRDIDTDKIINAGYRIIKYSNTKENSDLVRIQSLQGIMEAHNKFNTRGKDIVSLL